MGLRFEVWMATAWTGWLVWVCSTIVVVSVVASVEWVGVGCWWSTAGIAVQIVGWLPLVLSVVFGSEASRAWLVLGMKLGTAFRSAGFLVSMSARLLVLAAGSGAEAVFVVDFEQAVADFAVAVAVEVEERFVAVASAAAGLASFHPMGSLMPLFLLDPSHLPLLLQMAR